MPTEVTASVMIGTVAGDSYHGQPSLSPTGKLFCPSHVLVLMEGSRATWVVQRCPCLGRPTPTWRIRPSSPEHLLAAAVLGYVALTKPDVVTASDRLRDAVTQDPYTRELRIVPLDRELASHMFAACSQYVYGVVTTLPGSTITDDELQIAADACMQVAVAARAVARSAAAQ